MQTPYDFSRPASENVGYGLNDIAMFLKKIFKKYEQFMCAHPFEKRKKLSSKRRPDLHDSEDFVYMENEIECGKCGKISNDDGLVCKGGTKAFLARGRKTGK